MPLKRFLFQSIHILYFNQFLCKMCMKKCCKNFLSQLFWVSIPFKWHQCMLGCCMCIHNLQFDFRQQFSESQALINVSENLRKDLWKYWLQSFCKLTKSFWHCRPPDIVFKNQSLRNLWSFKQFDIESILVVIGRYPQMVMTLVLLI